MYEAPSWFLELWNARQTLAAGFATTLACSLLAVLGGTLPGTLGGLALTYGRWPLRLPFRLYSDLIRGTPAVVLELACHCAPCHGPGA